MPEALPTPYDILPVPYFPWTPSVAVWLSFIVLVLVASIIIRISAGKVQSDFYGPALDAAAAELKALLASPNFEAELELIRDKASIIGRRALSAAHPLPFASMGPSELGEAAEGLSGPIKGAALSLRDIDNLRYRSLDPELSRQSLMKFLAALELMRTVVPHG